MGLCMRSLSFAHRLWPSLVLLTLWDLSFLVCKVSACREEQLAVMGRAWVLGTGGCLLLVCGVHTVLALWQFFKASSGVRQG